MSVFLALPNAGNVSSAVIESVGRASNLFPVGVRVGAPCSILTHAFNLSWCEALNTTPRPKYFAMHHADIGAEAGWLDTLIHELETTDADVVSTVVPIKDMRGLTSTMLLDVENGSYRRISQNDLTALPRTFRASEVPWAPVRSILGINTGLWVARFDTWAESIRFHNTERNKRNDKGEFVPIVMPEDWNFGIDLHMMGLSVYATQAVNLLHYGTFGFSSKGAWGAEVEDKWNVI